MVRLIIEALRARNGDAPILWALMWSKLTAPARRMMARARSARAWRRFQASFALERAAAVPAHKPRRPIDARQREIVNAALAGTVKR